jgi:hypothetical protein
MILVFFCSNFDECHNDLTSVLKRCEECNLVLNWEKCHFVVTTRHYVGSFHF